MGYTSTSEHKEEIQSPITIQLKQIEEKEAMIDQVSEELHRLKVELASKVELERLQNELKTKYAEIESSDEKNHVMNLKLERLTEDVNRKVELTAQLKESLISQKAEVERLAQVCPPTTNQTAGTKTVQELPKKDSKVIVNESGEIIRVVRKLPPQHCILKVSSFTLVKNEHTKNIVDHIESTEFSAGGHKWVLMVYPNGNKKEDGSGHISFYIKNVEKTNQGIYATLRFFVYDQKRDIYTTISDVEEKRFSDVKRTWGIPKALPIESFTDASNGFLVNDCCVFGAEVLVLNGEMKTSSLSLLNAQNNRRYTWKIEKLSQYTPTTPTFYSPVFTIEGRRWKLRLDIQEAAAGEERSLLVVLVMDNPSDLTHGKQLYASFDLRLKNQLKGTDHYNRSVSHWYNCDAKNWGFPRFIPLSNVNDPKKGFLLNDAIILEVDIKVLFTVNDVDKSG